MQLIEHYLYIRRYLHWHLIACHKGQIALLICYIYSIAKLTICRCSTAFESINAFEDLLNIIIIIYYYLYSLVAIIICYYSCSLAIIIIIIILHGPIVINRSWENSIMLSIMIHYRYHLKNFAETFEIYREDLLCALY